MNSFNIYWIPCAEVSTSKWKCHIKEGATKISVPDNFLKNEYIAYKSKLIPVIHCANWFMKESVKKKFTQIVDFDD